MWRAEYVTTTDVAAERLYRAIIDVNRWTAWDDGLESTTLDGPARAGASFTLKPKGGPNVEMTIDEMRPHILVDTAHLFGARMRTTHEYTATGPGTTIRFAVEISGPLGFFWRKVVGEGQISGAPKQIAAFTAYARSLP